MQIIFTLIYSVIWSTENVIFLFSDLPPEYGKGSSNEYMLPDQRAIWGMGRKKGLFAITLD